MDAPPVTDDFAVPDPWDKQAEQVTLGAMMLSAAACADVTRTLEPGDFYRPAHQMIYAACLRLNADGSLPDPVRVAGHLTERGETGRCGGHPYLHTLIAAVPAVGNAGYYAKIVRAKAV